MNLREWKGPPGRGEGGAGRRLVAVTLITSAAMAGLIRLAPAQTDVAAEFREDPLRYYFDVRFDDALRLGEFVLADASTSEHLRDQTLVTIATVRLAQKKIPEARKALLRMLEGAPSKDLEEPARLPPPVTTLFYQLRDSLCLARFDELVAEKKLGGDIRTIAVGDFENNSIVKSAYDMDRFSRGLVHVLTSDLLQTSSLRVVDRQRLSVLLDELKLSRDPGLMQPEARVRLGQLTGAQSYFFGQIMQLGPRKLRIDLRWVDTSTGEILLAKSVEGPFASADDVMELERKLLVVALAPEMEKVLKARGQASTLRNELIKALEDRRASPKRAQYAQAVEQAGRAITLESSGDYGAAAAVWERVAALSPDDKVAPVRAASLRAFGGAGDK